MAEKVAKLGLKRDNNFMYFVLDDGVWRVPRKQPGKPKGKREKVAAHALTRDSGFLYFLDKTGDIARAGRAVGGQKRKKAAKKPAAKKAVKPAAKKAVKPAAKKPVKKAKAKK